MSSKPRTSTRATPIPKRPEPVNNYGIKVPPGTNVSQLTYDAWVVAYNYPFEKTGMPHRELMYRISDQLTPGYFEKHSWTDRVFDALGEDRRWIGFSGGAGTAKTHNIIGWAVNWWLCQPDKSSVILCSTTRAMLKKRGWAEVCACYAKLPQKIGNLVNSQMIWQAYPGEDKCAIFGKAVEEGSVNKVADDIKGIHTERQLIIVDEATGVREAIYAACSNLWSYPRDFKMVVIGNMVSWLDPMGKFCTPLNGRNSVTVDDDDWETVPNLDGKPGLVIHFDARKSPNIVEGKLVSRHLPTKEKVEAAITRAGSDTDPMVWANVFGFPPPEGILKVIFSEPMLHNGRAFDKPEKFTGRNMFVVGGCDPAYTAGGDRAIIRFATCGEIEGGGNIVSLGPPIILPLSATSEKKITFQLADRIQALCEKHKCPPANLAVDSSSQPGLCDVLSQQWGDVIRVSGSERASENRQVSHEDSRFCCDVYKTKVTELWFTMAEFVHAEQLRGLDVETAHELIERCYLGGTDGQKLQVEPKQLFKKRLGHSPDSGDAATLVCEAARIRGLQIKKIGRTAVVDTKILERRNDFQDLFQSADYTEREPDEYFEVV